MMNKNNKTITSSLYDECYGGRNDVIEKKLLSSSLAARNCKIEKPSHHASSRWRRHHARYDGRILAEDSFSSNETLNYFEQISDWMDEEDKRLNKSRSTTGDSHQSSENCSCSQHPAEESKLRASPTVRTVPSITTIGMTVYYEYDVDDREDELPSYLPSSYHDETVAHCHLMHHGREKHRDTSDCDKSISNKSPRKTRKKFGILTHL